jgi:7-keto-8-aminopelargonate synthetase-like enzyme
VKVYSHCDTKDLASALTATHGPKIVVTDSAFSMDGDVAPVDQLAELCACSGSLLVLDEAHSVLSPPFQPPEGLALVRVGTLSKTLGSLGGWATGPQDFMDLLVNNARSYIFTTALSPADAAAGLAALRILRSPEGDDLKGRLRHSIDRIAPGNPSPVVPIILGDEDRAMKASADLLDAGILVPAIRPPTVAAGTSRLRLALSAAHTDEMLDSLIDELRRLDLW